MFQEHSSWSLIDDASFVVFDPAGLEILGPAPEAKVMFQVSEDVHEAPVYLPDQDLLVFAELAVGRLPLLAVDLSQDPPVLFDYMPNPPVYTPNGAYYYDGLVWFAASGGNHSESGQEHKPSLQTYDPSTNETVIRLNNYYGYYFNTIDDLAVHPITGDVWFTDPGMSMSFMMTPKQTQNRTATDEPNSLLMVHWDI